MANDQQGVDLNAHIPDETVKITDRVTAELTSVLGFVAVLDALGTKLRSLPSARTFMERRNSVMEFATNTVGKSLPGFASNRHRTFMLNDTVLFTYEPGKVDLVELGRFCHWLRVFEAYAIMKEIFFRGSFAIGEFFVGDDKTVLGPPVSDAASWYEAADWIGVHATPHATMLAQSLLDARPPGADFDHVLIDYSVPLSGKPALKLKAVNWPKGYYLDGIRPPGKGLTRALVARSLTGENMPKGSESKYSNTLDFFDYVEQKQDLDRTFLTRQSGRNP